MGSTAATPAGRRRAAARAPAKGGRTKAKRARAGGGSATAAKNGQAGRTRSGSAAKAGGSRKRAGGAGRSEAPRPKVPAGAPWRRRLAVVGAVVAALAAGYFLWLRDSSLVAVTDVTVEGAESADSQRIAAALTRAAEGMTTLNVDDDRLEAVAARFPTVESVHAETAFPRGMTIEVVERPPALAARAGGEEVAVAADGTVLPGVDVERRLPRLDVERLPPSGRLGGDELAEALVVAAAPEPLRPLVRRIKQSPELGIEAVMRGGITLRFGTGANAAAKWAAAAAVLADPRLESASYVDVRVPQRPAVGGGDADAGAAAATEAESAALDEDPLEAQP